MKKIKYLILTLLLTVISIPIVFAASNVEIDNVELVSKSKNTIINGEPTFKGLEINYNISFQNPGDSVKYKVTIKNKSNLDYKIADDTQFSKSNYIKYEYETSKDLKAKSSTEVLLTITYNKEISKDKFKNGKYIESNTAVVKLLNNEKNPETSSFNIILTIATISLIIVLSLRLIKKNRYIKRLIIITMFSIASIPIITKAIEEIKLTINVKVEIVNASSASSDAEFKVVYVYDEYSIFETLEEAQSNGYGEKCTPIILSDNPGLSDPLSHIASYICSRETTKEDPIKYSAGDEVSIKQFEVDGVKGNADDGLATYCYGMTYGLYCNQIIPTTYPVYRWEYNKSIITEYGYTYLDNDDTVMSFKSETSAILNKWNQIGFIVSYSGDEFTMPAHDVLLKEYHSIDH